MQVVSFIFHLCFPTHGQGLQKLLVVSRENNPGSYNCVWILSIELSVPKIQRFFCEILILGFSGLNWNWEQCNFYNRWQTQQLRAVLHRRNGPPWCSNRNRAFVLLVLFLPCAICRALFFYLAFYVRKKCFLGCLLEDGG